MINLVFSSEISDVIMRAYVYCFRDKSPSVYRINVHIFDENKKTYCIGYFPEPIKFGSNLRGIDRYWKSIPTASELNRFEKISVNDLTSLKWGCIVLKNRCRYRSSYLQKHWQSKIDRPIAEISFSVSMSYTNIEPIFGKVCLIDSVQIDDFPGEIISLGKFRSYRALLSFCCSNVILYTNDIYIFNLLPKSLNCTFLGENIEYPIRKDIDEVPEEYEIIKENFLPVLPLYRTFKERNHYWIYLGESEQTDIFCKGSCKDFDLNELQRISLR